jgi:hypothetical protein
MDDARGEKQQGLFGNVLPAALDLRREGNDGLDGFAGSQRGHGG